MIEERALYSSENCTIAGTLAIVGEKWTLLVLREAFYGVRRFADFQETLGCARNILSDRLATLVDHGILAKEPYREPGQRERSEYRLTRKGMELFPALLALMEWGDQWVAGEGNEPVVVRHRDCGAVVDVELRCRNGHRGLSARDTAPEPGPGARALEPTAAR